MQHIVPRKARAWRPFLAHGFWGEHNTYKQSVIHSSSGQPGDGQNPYYDAGVVLDAKGNIYGTTLYVMAVRATLARFSN
jgi:hypothetical protein